MKKLNKRGSALIELAVMCTILMVGILTTYKQFSSSMQIQQKTITYRNVGNEAKLVYFKEYLKDSDENWRCDDDPESENNCKLNVGKDIINDDDHQYFKAVFDIDRVFLLSKECDSVDGYLGLSEYLKKTKQSQCDSPYKLAGIFVNKNTDEETYGVVEYPQGECSIK